LKKGSENYGGSIMSKQHSYTAEIKWTGNLGTGTSAYTAYSRAHEVSGDGGKQTILASADPIYRGEESRYNPEELVVAAISGCHLLWYLHLCADAGVVVVDYTDSANGTLTENDDGNGKFSEVTINPQVTITKDSDAELAEKLHDKAHEFCFIANSMNFPVSVKPTIIFENKKTVR
jgi:organic hydroperoxide reductase OsmC/OhrA